MTEAVKHYPAWQETFRKAQAERDRQDAEALAQKERENAEYQLLRAGQLGKALAFLGMDAKPEQNNYVLDGYHFQLVNIFTVHPAKGDEPETLQFALKISKPQPHVYPGDPDNASQIIDVAAHYASYHKHKTMVEIADAFDFIDKEIAWREEELKIRAERKAAQPEEDWQKPAESDEQKLMKLLRSLIREVVTEELYS